MRKFCLFATSVTDAFYGWPSVDVFNVLKQWPVEGDAIVTRAVTGNLLDNTNTQIFWLWLSFRFHLFLFFPHLSLSCPVLLPPSSPHQPPLQSRCSVLIVGALVQSTMKSVLLLLSPSPLPSPSRSTWKLIWSPPDDYRCWNAPRNRSTNSGSAKTPSLPDSF